MKPLPIVYLFLIHCLISISQSNGQIPTTRSLRSIDNICNGILRVPHWVVSEIRSQSRGYNPNREYTAEEFVSDYNRKENLKKDNKYLFLSKETYDQYGARYSFYYLIPANLYGLIQYEILPGGEVTCNLEERLYAERVKTKAYDDSVAVANQKGISILRRSFPRPSSDRSSSSSSSRSSSSSSSGSASEKCVELEKRDDDLKVKMAGYDIEITDGYYVLSCKNARSYGGSISADLFFLPYSLKAKSWPDTDRPKGWYVYDVRSFGAIRDGPYESKKEAIQKNCDCK